MLLHGRSNPAIAKVLSSRSKREIRQCEKNLRNLAKADADFTIISESAKKLMNGHFEWINPYQIESLYRGRKWNKSKLPSNVSELLAKKPKDLEDYGRLNFPGQSLLYVGEFAQTILNELRL